MSDKVVAEMVRLLGKPLFGAAMEARRTLVAIDPPPKPLLAAAASTDPTIRSGALRSLSTLEGLPVNTLAAAATEPGFSRGEEAATLFAKRCARDLRPLVDVIVSTRSQTARSRLLKLLRVNLNQETGAGVVGAVRAKLPSADVESAGGLLQAAASVGSNDAWTLLSETLPGKRPGLRNATIEALGKWPDRKPLDMLMKIASSKEDMTTRVIALRSVLPMVEGKFRRQQPDARLKGLLETEVLARELGLMKPLLGMVGRIPHPVAVGYLGRYVQDKELGENAVRAMIGSAKATHVDHAAETATLLDGLGKKLPPGDDRDEFRRVARDLRSKVQRKAPSLDKAGDDIDLDL